MPSTEPFSDLLIHVGYHKAASTLLQRVFFVPERGFWSPWSQVYYHQAIMLDRPDRGWSTRVRSAFEDGIEEARRRGLRPVLTCEGLSGDMWRAGQANGFGNFHVADVLAEAFPGARILIVHREQVSMIVSLYKHSVRSHWATSLPNFLDQTPRVAGMAPLLNLGYLEYSWLLGHYRTLFGGPSVTALPFELVRDDPGSWATRLEQVTGSPVDASWFRAGENRGMSAPTARIKSRLNLLIPQTANPDVTRVGQLVNTCGKEIDRLVPKAMARKSEERLLAKVRDAVGTYFETDNNRLFSVVGEDWRPFGYAGSARHERDAAT